MRGFAASPKDVHIPGAYEFIDQGSIPIGSILLLGPSGVGKTIYCNQFFTEGLRQQNLCMLVTADGEKKIREHLFKNTKTKSVQNLKIINPISTVKKVGLSSTNAREDNDGLSLALAEIKNQIIKARKSDKSEDQKGGSNPFSHVAPIRVVVDSLNPLLILFGESSVLKFITELIFLLKQYDVMSIITLTSTQSESDHNLINSLSSVANGILEMKLEDNVNMAGRKIRLRSMKGASHNPSWINFKISNDGTILFSPSESSLSCILCGNPILGDPLVFLEMPFDKKACLDTYRKLLNVYGRNVSELGLPEVVNLNFFYVDIVGLSNPSLSVNKQVTKIIVLNRLITSCEAFSKSAKDRKIIFPTGDGMSIGFLSNMELPLQLSIELHKKLRAYNSEKKDEDVVNVRIGLNRGPVFLVTDLNGNHDLWGPGIILTRRVMDLGDSNHILLEGDFAEELIQLRDDYKTILYPIGKYPIKHGQELRLYSAYSTKFGNSVPPAKR